MIEGGAGSLDDLRFHDRVVDDLAPLLERDVLKFLKDGAGSLRRETRMVPRMDGAVAYDAMANVYEFEFRTTAMGTHVKVANF